MRAGNAIMDKTKTQQENKKLALLLIMSVKPFWKIKDPHHIQQTGK